MVNFARSSLASALRTFIGAAKSCAPVTFFKIPPPSSAGDQEAPSTIIQILPSIAAISWQVAFIAARLCPGVVPSRTAAITAQEGITDRQTLIAAG
jgi:hypothetical protein